MSQISGIMDTIKRQKKGDNIIEGIKTMIRFSADVIVENESKMVLGFRDYLVEIFFSNIQPLMVIRLVKSIKIPDCYEIYKIANDLNKDCIYGCHCFDIQKKRYYFQSTHWLQGVLSSKTLYEMLEIYDIEAKKVLSQM